MKRIFISLAMVAFVGVVAAGATGAFFSSTATSTGNTFAAGTLELLLAHDEDGNFQSTKSNTWSLTNLAPGGTPEESSIWLLNDGSVDGETIGVAMDNASATVSNTARQMRITTMTFDGENLLEGGAGATIPEYEAPTNCTITVGGSGNPTRITDAIDQAVDGDVICATGSNYSVAWESGASAFTSPNIVVDKEVTIASMGGPQNTSSTGFTVIADNVTVRGFSVNNTGQDTGILVDGVDGAVVEHNVFNNFGDINGTTDKQAVYLVNGPTNSSVRYNMFDGVRNGTKSVKAIYVGHTGGAPNASNITIEHNVVKDVESVGGGGYGVLVNHAGASSNVVVQNNTFENVTGLWVSVVGLEGDTPNAQVLLNTFVGLNGTTYPANAVHFEDNPSASSVAINQNNFESVSGGVALHPTNQAGVYTIDATNNWWGDFDPSDQVFKNNSTVDTSSFAGGPFVGLVNGNDANGNGFADLQDLNGDPILDTTPGLLAGEKKEFVMAVQLDGPTTGNSFKGASLTTDIVFTLNQVSQN